MAIEHVERQFSTRVADGAGSCCTRFCVAEVCVRIVGDDREAVALAPPLVPFQKETGFPDIDIRVEWVRKLSSASGSRLFDSGALWSLHTNSGGYQFDFVAPVFGEAPYKRLLIDSDFSRATLEMTEGAANLVPQTAPLDYPLDELLIMHRLTQEKAIELHGSGIVRADGIGNLFVGHSGAGKSTTTRLWTAREDVEVLSDDRIIVRRDAESASEKSPLLAKVVRNGAPGGQQVLRLCDCPASPAGHSPQDDKKFKMRMYGTPWHGEAMFASPGSAPLARIFVLEHGTGNLLTPLSPSQAVAELFARSFVPFHRHEYVDSALEFLQELTEAVPVYRYAFEPDQRAVDTILNLHD